MNDLSNKEQIVLNYMRELAKTEFPNLDLSDNGAFMEMFGTPHVRFLTPLLEFADRIKLTQSLDNAELMTEEEMDEVAAGHFSFRKSGEYATGFATLSFDDIPANGVIQIAAGTEAESKQGLRFRSIETTILNEEALANYYNTDLFRYQIPVFFEAENPGIKYNIEANELVRMITPLAHLAEVTNEIAFKGGRDRETNVELAERIKKTAGTPNVGVERGWKRFAMDFEDVQDVIVAGYGHPLMKRDVVGIAPPGRFSAGVSHDVHWGGKIDLHIRGKNLAEYAETKRLSKNEAGELYIELLQHPTYDILQLSFTSPRYTDPDLDPSFFLVRDFLLMKNEDPETIGTLNEQSWVIIKDDRLDEFDTVTVRYRYNQLIHDINQSLYHEQNRPPGSDVLLKEARKKTIHSGMIVRLNSTVRLQEKDRSAIRQRLFNWVNQMPMGAELYQYSDFTQPIYEENLGDTQVASIHLPTQFIVTDYDNRFLYYCLNEEKRNFLNQLKENSFYFSNYLTYYQDEVTIYDFFDILHLLTYQNVAKDAWKSLASRNNVWGSKVHFVNMAKRMLGYVNAIQRLSLPQWPTQENDYFELGHLAVYEDITYQESDLENIVNMFEAIANPGTATYTTNNILHLTVFCAVMLYVLTAEDSSSLSTKDLFDWLLELTKGTPIDSEVHH